MPHQITINPSGHSFACAEGETVLTAAMAADLMLPYGCRNGACGTCKGKIVDGRVDYGPHQPGTLTDDEKRQGLALFCCAEPLTDLVLEIREVRRAGDIQIRKLPCRIESIDKPAPDVAIVRIKLPANERLQFLAGQYIDLLLKDGRRRSFSLATPPHDDALLELHIRQIPGGFFTNQLFAEFKGREILRFEGPLGTFFLREDSDKPIILVAGGTGFAPIKGVIEHALHHHIDAARPMVLYWGARAKRDLYLPDLPGSWQQASRELHVHPGAFRSRPGRRLARPHRPRPSGGARRFRGSLRISGLRVRRPGNGRCGPQDLRRDARVAIGGILRRQLHVRRAGAYGHVVRLKPDPWPTPHRRRVAVAPPSGGLQSRAGIAAPQACPSPPVVSPGRHQPLLGGRSGVMVVRGLIDNHSQYAYRGSRVLHRR